MAQAQRTGDNVTTQSSDAFGRTVGSDRNGLYNADDLRSALASAIDSGATRIVVDMSEVEFIDSTALGVLVEARSKLGRDGLLLAGPQLETRRTLQVSGLDRHLPVHDSVDAALASPAE